MTMKTTNTTMAMITGTMGTLTIITATTMTMGIMTTMDITTITEDRIPTYGWNLEMPGSW